MDSAIRMLRLKADFFDSHNFFLSVAGGQHLQLPKGPNGCHDAMPSHNTHAQIWVAFLAVWLCCLFACLQFTDPGIPDLIYNWKNIRWRWRRKLPFTLRIEETKQNDIMLLLKQLLLRFRCSTFFLVGATSLDTCQTAVSTIQGQLFQYALLELNCRVAESVECRFGTWCFGSNARCARKRRVASQVSTRQTRLHVLFSPCRWSRVPVISRSKDGVKRQRVG